MEENIVLSQDERRDFSAGVFYVAGLGKDTLIGTLSDDTLLGNANQDYIYGNKGNDVLNGNQDEDQVYGGEGNDTINGGAGNDTIYGDGWNSDTDTDPLTSGFGNDVISGDLGDDWIYGNQGNDQLDGGEGNDRIWGGKGNDLISGGNGNDELNGDQGDDRIFGGPGNDNINGGDGNDQIFGEEGDNFLVGGAGQDIIYGGAGNDVILGDDPNAPFGFGNNNDVLFGGEGNDIILGGFGDDQIYGNQGNDILDGGQGNDLIYGGQGDDTVSGGDGNDRIFGDKGNDVLMAGTGDDEISGGEGNDSITGNEGNDTIDGGDGDDTIYGGEGNDVLRGGAGRDLVFGDKGNDTLILDPGDTVTGGEGDDVFRLIRGNGAFNPAEAAQIADFRGSGLDVLELSGGLKFEDLNIFDGIGENAGKAIVQDKLTGQTLAVLNAIAAADLTQDKFIPVVPAPPVDEPDQPLNPVIFIPDGSTGSGTPPPPPPPVEVEPATIAFALADFIINEDGAPVGAKVTVKRSGDLTSEVTVDVVRAGGTATPQSAVAEGQPFDFDDSVFPITLTFAENEGEKDVVIPIEDNNNVEPTETIELALTNLQGENAQFGPVTTAILSILDNDDPGNLGFAAAEYTVDENGGSIDVQVRRSGGTSGEISVDVILEETPPSAGASLAVAGEDFTNIFGTPLTINFANGESVQNITIPILDDNPPTRDGTKELRLKLVNPNPPIVPLDTIQTTAIRILDDDIPTLTISAVELEADEADPDRKAVFEISSTLGAEQPRQLVNLKIAGTATLGVFGQPQPPADYVISGLTEIAAPTVFIQGGSTRFEVFVPEELDDDLNEGPESIEIEILPGTTPGDYNIGADKDTILYAIDDDKPTVAVEALGQIAEGSPSQPAEFRFTLRGQILQPMTVNFTVGGSATSGTDYRLSGNSVTFNPADVDPVTNQATKSITVTPLDDQEREPTETISLRLQNPPGDEYAIDPEKNRGTVTLLDNESSLLIFTASNPITYEVGTVDGEFKINRFGGSANPITVNYEIDTTVEKAAIPGIDYDIASLPGFNQATLRGSLTMAVGQESAVLPIKPINDGISGEPLTEFITFKLLEGNGYEDPTGISGTIQLVNNGG
jgi:Ca2+-binding RTX toxin-like protein